MPKASVKRTINCSKEDLINLVLNIEDYPNFIPYCLNAKIYEKKLDNDNQLIIADLTIGKGPFKDTYKSDVKYIKKDDIILVKNIDGPLKYLDNKCQFIKKYLFKNKTRNNFQKITANTVIKTVLSVIK